MLTVLWRWATILGCTLGGLKWRGFRFARIRICGFMREILTTLATTKQFKQTRPKQISERLCLLKICVGCFNFGQVASLPAE